jgi:hypothetical protein
MDVDRPTDFTTEPAQTPNRVRAGRFGGPLLREDAEFSTSGLLIKTCVLSSASGKVATVRGNDVRFPTGLRLSYEDFRAGARPRHGRTVLVDLFGDVKASAEWSAIDHYFHVHGAEVTYAVDRSDRRHRWRLHGDGVVAEFDHRHFEVFDTIPTVAALLAWKVARILEHLPGFGAQREMAWNRGGEILGS